MTEWFTKYKIELMGICICWIVLFHSGINAPTNMILRAIWYMLVSFGGVGVNIFLLLSGFGITFSSLKREKENRRTALKDYYKRRLQRILPIYFSIAIAYYVLTCRSIYEIIYKTFFLNFIFAGERDFWYVLLILACYAIYPLFDWLRKKTNAGISFSIAIMIAIAAALLLKINSPTIYDNLEIALWRFPCFWLGCYYGVITYSHQKKKFIAVTLASMMGGFIFLAFTGLSRCTFALFSPIVLLAICFFLEVINAKRNYVGKILEFFGKISLELYLIHVSFGVLIREKIAIHFGESLGLAAYFVLSVVIAVWVFTVMQKAMKRTNIVS